MTTAIELINQASRMAGVRGGSQTLAAEDSSTYLAILNQYVDSLTSEGLDLGIGTLSNSTTLYVEDSDLLALRYNLAQLIAEDSGLPLDLRVLARAEDLKRSMIEKYLDIPDAEMPDALKSRLNGIYDIESD